MEQPSSERMSQRALDLAVQAAKKERTAGRQAAARQAGRPSGRRHTLALRSCRGAAAQGPARRHRRRRTPPRRLPIHASRRTWAQQRGVQRIWPVGGHEHLLVAGRAGRCLAVGPPASCSGQRAATLNAGQPSGQRCQAATRGSALRRHHPHHLPRPGSQPTLMLPRASKPSSWLTISSMVRCTSLSPLASSCRAPPMASTCGGEGDVGVGL